MVERHGVSLPTDLLGRLDRLGRVLEALRGGRWSRPATISEMIRVMEEKEGCNVKPKK
jgi:metal-responsive CopG/Arc/MetJ family transcriptional regulator